MGTKRDKITEIFEDFRDFGSLKEAFCNRGVGGSIPLVFSFPIRCGCGQRPASGGWSRSLISGRSMFSGDTKTTPVSIRLSTFSPRRCLTIVITER
jgi:hypothetical protein